MLLQTVGRDAACSEVYPLARSADEDPEGMSKTRKGFGVLLIEYVNGDPWTLL